MMPIAAPRPTTRRSPIAFPNGSYDHIRIARHLYRRLTPARDDHFDEPDFMHDDGSLGELQAFLRCERDRLAPRWQAAPTDADAFVAWFEELIETGPGQGDPLFPWLAEHADMDAMRWFLSQELAGEAGFDDLVALVLIRMPDRPKMEMARNFWDEFGRGNPKGVHGALLARMAERLGLSCPIEAAMPESLALANLMAGLAVEGHAYHGIGALGAIELTAPGRVACVAEGMRRLGLPAVTRRYFELHATIDIEHFRRWNDEVLRPLVAERPYAAQHLAAGAIMRLEAGRRCFARYREELGV